MFWSEGDLAELNGTSVVGLLLSRLEEYILTLFLQRNLERKTQN